MEGRILRSASGRVAAIALAATLALASGMAGAHAHLMQAAPAADGKVREAHQVRLTFSEALEPRFSTIRLQAVAGKEIDTPAAALDAADPRVLVLTLKEPLAAGAYQVQWSVVATDGHRMTGVYGFTVAP